VDTGNGPQMKRTHSRAGAVSDASPSMPAAIPTIGSPRQKTEASCSRDEDQDVFTAVPPSARAPLR
jgi:hypothetical protein